MDLFDLVKSGTPKDVTTAIVGLMDANAQDGNGDTLLILAVKYNPNPDVIRLLAKVGADVNRSDRKGVTPLVWAVKFAKADAVIALLESGANAKALDVDLKPAIKYADGLKGTRAYEMLQKASVVDPFAQLRPAATASKGSCFVATAVFEDYDSPEVMKLRNFRDLFLSRHSLGRIFIRVYYKCGPYFASGIKTRPRTKKILRAVFKIFL